MSKLGLLLSLLLTALATLALFAGPWFPLHDATHVERVVEMTKTISSGQFPPLWADQANAGYGYPLFHFYAPLFHLTAVLLSTLFPVTLALKLVLVLATGAGSYGVYQLARCWGRAGGVIATTAFILSPYLAVNLYVRGALAEYLSLLLLPWVFFLFQDLSTRRRVAAAALVLALFVLSHNLIPLLSALPILLWAYWHNRPRPHRLITVLILAFLLSSWFTLPLLFERNFTQADAIARTTNYSLHFLQPWQIWNSTWGFGGSAPGVQDGMSFKLGKLTIILAAVGALTAIYRRARPELLITLFAVGSLLLTLSLSQPIWAHLKVLQIAQFPWRLLGPLALFLSLLAGYSTSLLRSRHLRSLLVLVSLGLIILPHLQYFRPQSYLSTVTPTQDLVEIVPEYQPVWFTPPATPARPLPTQLTGPARIVLDRAYYPTWRATLDGALVSLSPSSTGLVELTVPPGTHTLRLWQAHTSLQVFAYVLTLLSLGIAAGLLQERS